VKLILTFILFLAIVIGSCCDKDGGEKGNDTIDSVPDLHGPKVVSCDFEAPPPALSPNVAYTVQFIDLCSANPEVLVSGQEKKQRGTRIPYNYEKQDTKDSLILSYEFIDDCCMPYRGDAYQSNGDLYLGFYLPRADSVTSCDCWCKYQMQYRIKKDSVAWNAILIVRGYASSLKTFCDFGSEFKLVPK
jgi:hypothetical protein